MSIDIEPLEKIWNDLLSRDDDVIKAAFVKLDQASREAVTIHLSRMANETGWHQEQKLSAEIALKIIHHRSGKRKHQ